MEELKTTEGIYNEEEKGQLEAQNEETKIQLETINQYIDMDMAEFLVKVTAKSFTELNAMIQLMDIEYVRLLEMREDTGKQFATVKSNSDKYKAIFFDYITTFVLEQKIIDRKSCLNHIKTIKGVANVMTAPRSTTAQSLAKAPRSSSGHLSVVSDMEN